MTYICIWMYRHASLNFCSIVNHLRLNHQQSFSVQGPTGGVFRLDLPFPNNCSDGKLFVLPGFLNKSMEMLEKMIIILALYLNPSVIVMIVIN